MKAHTMNAKQRQLFEAVRRELELLVENDLDGASRPRKRSSISPWTI